MTGISSSHNNKKDPQDEQPDLKLLLVLCMEPKPLKPNATETQMKWKNIDTEGILFWE